MSTFLAWIVQGIPELLVDKTASEFVQRAEALGVFGSSGATGFKFNGSFKASS